MVVPTAEYKCMGSRGRPIVARSLMLLPLVLCAFAWVWSYWFTERIEYFDTNRWTLLQIALGEIQLWSAATFTGDVGWTHTRTRPDREFSELYSGLPHWQFLGIHAFWGSHPYSPYVSAAIVVIPIWQIILAMCAILVILLWRSHRRQSPRGFAITEAKD